MGCDIHAQVEMKPWPDYQGYWEFAEISFLPRNYFVFCAMAGVRNSGHVTAVAEPRGVPEDSCGDTKERAAGSDWHSHSWLTPDEFAEALRRADTELPEYHAVLALMRTLGKNARLVFWFDN